MSRTRELARHEAGNTIAEFRGFLMWLSLPCSGSIRTAHGSELARQDWRAAVEAHRYAVRTWPNATSRCRSCRSPLGRDGECMNARCELCSSEDAP